jgi:imidazole glycerol phosphate synthase subunit HisF
MEGGSVYEITSRYNQLWTSTDHVEAGQRVESRGANKLVILEVGSTERVREYELTLILFMDLWIFYLFFKRCQ